LQLIAHGAGRVSSITINWDDGSNQTIATADPGPDSGTRTFTVTHTYSSDPNFYFITASFTAQDGSHAGANTLLLTELVPGIDVYDIIALSSGHTGTATIENILS